MSKHAITGVLLDEQVFYSLRDVCLVCGSHTEWVVELVEQGFLPGRPQIVLPSVGEERARGDGGEALRREQ